MAGSYIPERGDLIYLQFTPNLGREQGGHRPALVLSPLRYNEKTGLAVVCPITSQQKGYPFEKVLPDDLPIHGVILTDHIKNLDWRSREAQFIAKIPKNTLDEVVSTICIFIGDEASA